MVVVPLGRLVNYLSSSPRIERVSRRAVGVTVGGAAVLIGLLGVVPAPDVFTAPGIVQAEQYAVVHTGSEGDFAEAVTPSGQAVQPGDVLIRLTNSELTAEVRAARAEVVVCLQDELVIRHMARPLRAVLDSVLRHGGVCGERIAWFMIRSAQKRAERLAARRRRAVLVQDQWLEESLAFAKTGAD